MALTLRSLFDDFQPLISTSYKMLGELSKEMDAFARNELGKHNNNAFHGVDVDIINKADQYIIQADFPGFTKNDVNIEVTDEGFLRLSAERNVESKSANEGTYMRKYGSFVKELRLPEDTDMNNIKARMENGVLTVSLKKMVKPVNTRRIQLE